jgi:hypothetical protein
LISIDPINSYVIKNIELDDEKFDEKFKNTRLFFTDNKNA